MTKPEFRRFSITLRALEVIAIRDLSPRMRRISLAGSQLGCFTRDGIDFPAFESPGPDDHVKLFLPDPASGILSLPVQGDGRLHWPENPPVISREYTPRGFDPAEGRLDLDFVLHGHGVAGAWAARARIGDRLHLGGPRASMVVPKADRYLLLGDETAIPAIANWLEMLPAEADATAHILIAHESARIPLASEAAVAVNWHLAEAAHTDALATLAAAEPISPSSFVWAGAERGTIARLRETLERSGVAEHQMRLSNYWTAAQI